MKTYLNPKKGQLSTLKDIPDNVELCMLNLLKFKADGGKEKYKKYMIAAEPFIRSVKAEVIYYGNIHSTLIGPDTNEWDKIILVKYINKNALLSMLKAEGYPHHLRTDALKDSRLISIPTIKK